VRARKKTTKKAPPLWDDMGEPGFSRVDLAVDFHFPLLSFEAEREQARRVEDHLTATLREAELLARQLPKGWQRTHALARVVEARNWTRESVDAYVDETLRIERGASEVLS
jgi:hypothetical protein